MEATASDFLTEANGKYLGEWNTLVSTTNWEKGEIILAWRKDLIRQEAPGAEYSDEAWSRLVDSSVTSQHVGRLRRVAERFGQQRTDYEGLYWSHFCKALEWDDAEMWLEGAVQNDWSVSQMRAKRTETLGDVEDSGPTAEESVSIGQTDEQHGADAVEQTVSSSVEEVRDPEQESSSPSQSEQSHDDDQPRASSAAQEVSPESEALEEAAVRPFEDLPMLPDDLADAFEEFKLGILRHKVSGWEEVTQEEVIASLEALKQLVLAPSKDTL